ncbi:hypothetical protein GCM10009118_09970 [Wandonia haliotis]|uniref:DUF4783 domain-containing protein n=2 Tax=Wandonia haliotis TaxID=574963 RepID=A0ABN1MNX5_9FLAO
MTNICTFAPTVLDGVFIGIVFVDNLIKEKKVMKFLTVIVTFLVLSGSLFSQDRLYTDLERAFQNGDEKSIVAHASDRLLLDIDKKESMYSRSQAEMILRDFFSKNRPNSFKLIFKGNAKSSSAYAVGILEAGSKKFRVTITLKENGNSFKIEQLSVEED